MRERAARERETERSGEARDDAGLACGESGGVHGAQVARPACGGGLSERQGRCAERAAGLGAGPPDSPGRLRRGRSASERSAVHATHIAYDARIVATFNDNNALPSFA